MRTIVEIPDDLVEALDRLKAREGASRSALVRRAIESFLGERGLADWRPCQVSGAGGRRARWPRPPAARALGVEAVRALFDTNILVDYLNGHRRAADEIGRYDERLISRISWMET